MKNGDEADCFLIASIKHQFSTIQEGNRVKTFGN